MKHGQFGNLVQLATELERRSSARTDYVVDMDHMTLTSDENGSVLTAGVQGHGMIHGNMKDLALSQLTSRLDIPAKYHRKLVQEAPELLDRNVNHWLQRSAKASMLRSLDGNIDAVLSNKYKRIDNGPVAEMVLPVLADPTHGIEIKSCDITDTRMYIKAVSPRMQGDIAVGDPVQMGVIISNSEVGLGALDIRAFVYRLVCENGMISGHDLAGGIRRTHLGAKQDYGVVYADDTMARIGDAMASQVRDTVKNLLDPEHFMPLVTSMRESVSRRVTGDPVKAVEQLGKTVGFTQDEGKGIMRHLIEGGDLSQWGMLNAITRYAQDKEISYDRATELEIMGGKVLELGPNQWRNISEAA